MLTFLTRCANDGLAKQGSFVRRLYLGDPDQLHTFDNLKIEHAWHTESRHVDHSIRQRRCKMYYSSMFSLRTLLTRPWSTWRTSYLGQARWLSTTAPTLTKRAMPPRPGPIPEEEFTEVFLKGTGPGGQKIVHLPLSIYFATSI